ncbi:MAG: hypothetical protein JRI61_09000 [Deltaproteobacteria bacterium]|nr:hypothetical protein [Deltaproteobacteria bacterium]
MGNLYAGKILRVNLTDKSTVVEPTETYENLVGGKGINLRLLFNSVDANTEALGPDNVLLFGAGPLVGTTFPGASRTDVMGKSPVTGHYGNAGLGGYLAAELKFAGYDNLIISGRADSPVYLHISDNEIQIRDASEIWGNDTYDTPNLVRKDAGDPKAQVVCIGPAGERQVIYAAIMSGTGNAAARTGLGAVMGSKNLKAISVRGASGIGIAHPEEFIEQTKILVESVKKARYYEELHTVGLTRIHDLEMRRAHHLLGTEFPEGESILEVDFIKEHLHRRIGCFACPVACFDGYKIPGAGSGSAKCSPYGDLSWDVKNADLMVFWKSYVECQRYGLDARSLANAIAWLMTLYEHGIISAKETDGLSMEWGSAEALVEMARKVSLREGIGDLIADGLPAAAQKIGRGAEEYLILAKGSPSDMHVVPIKTATLASAVSPIGEDAQIQSFIGYATVNKYLQAENEDSFQKSVQKYKDSLMKQVGTEEAVDPRLTKGKAELIRQEEERTDILDMTGACAWLSAFTGLPVDAEAIARFMSLGLGREISPEMLSESATRMHHLERSFLAKCGLTRQDDVNTKAHYGRLKPGGKDVPEIGCTEEELEAMKDEYYSIMGWDLITGMPTRETLEKYGLSDVADDLGI